MMDGLAMIVFLPIHVFYAIQPQQSRMWEGHLAAMKVLMVRVEDWIVASGHILMAVDLVMLSIVFAVEAAPMVVAMALKIAAVALGWAAALG